MSTVTEFKTGDRVRVHPTFFSDHGRPNRNPFFLRTDGGEGAGVVKTVSREYSHHYPDADVVLEGAAKPVNIDICFLEKIEPEETAAPPVEETETFEITIPKSYMKGRGVLERIFTCAGDINTQLTVKCPPYDGDESEQTTKRPSLTPQCRTLLRQLQHGKALTSRSALLDFSIAALPRRISDLREHGYKIDSVMCKNPLTGQRYAKYTLNQSVAA